MQTESPTSLELATSTLLRMQKTLSHFLDLSPQSHSIKLQLPNCNLPICKLTTETEHLVKLLIRKVGQNQKGYESQLQKCQQRLRKNAKSSCEMKLYCEYLEDELRNVKNQKKRCEKDIECLTTSYNKQIQTLKTELTNAAVTKRAQYEGQSDFTKKPADILTKIKTKLLNMGGNIYEEPQSCINTFRKNIYSPLDEDVIHQSEPISKGSSPKQSKKKDKSSEGKSSSKKKRSKSVSNFKPPAFDKKKTKNNNSKPILKAQLLK